jgi:DNA polymerase-1
VLVGWDTLDAPTYRHRALATYQSGRVFDAELVDQLDMLPQFVAECGFAYAKAPGYQADDFLAAAVAQEERRGGTAIVASGDSDAFQLASERNDDSAAGGRAGEMVRIGPAEVRERYGVEPAQVPDFIALRGDPSDKIPGLAGVGPKGGAQSVAPLRLARSGTRAGQLCGLGGAVAALPVDCDDGRVRSAPAAR